MIADKKKEEDYHVIRPGGSLIIAYQIKHKNVLIIGGGNVAAGRIINVLEADGHITLIAPQKGIIPEVQHRINTGQIHTYKNKTFEPSDLDGVDMCLTAIDDEKESSRIWKLCKERKIPVNVADVPGECDFYFGSVYRDGPLQIMISTNGAAPKLANMIRVLVGERLPRNTGRGCENVGKLRRKLRSLAPGQGESSKRMKWMIEVCKKYSLDQLVQLEDKEMDTLLLYYRDGKVPPYNAIKTEQLVYEFDGSFGFAC